MFAGFGGGLSWSQMAGRTVRQIQADRCFGLAAQLAFYFVLALFPAMLILLALIAYLPIENAMDGLLLAIGSVAPRELVALLRDQMNQISDDTQPGLLTVGILGTLWSSSSGMVAIIDALNQVYAVAEWRPWWKRRLVAVALSAALTVLIAAALVLGLVGPGVLAQAFERMAGQAPAELPWSVLRWPAMIGCVVLGADLVFYCAPNRPARWTWITPGAVLAAALWIAGSFAFRFYLGNLADYAATYGAIGGAIVTMLWFYLSGLAILAGAELNSVIEQRRPVPHS